MAANNISLPAPLLAELQSAAQMQHRSADEIAAEAVTKYLKAQKWTRFVERNNDRARSFFAIRRQAFAVD